MSHFSISSNCFTKIFLLQLASPNNHRRDSHYGTVTLRSLVLFSWCSFCRCCITWCLFFENGKSTCCWESNIERRRREPHFVLLSNRIEIENLCLLIILDFLLICTWFSFNKPPHYANCQLTIISNLTWPNLMKSTTWHCHALSHLFLRYSVDFKFQVRSTGITNQCSKDTTFSCFIEIHFLDVLRVLDLFNFNFF